MRLLSYNMFRSIGVYLNSEKIGRLNDIYFSDKDWRIKNITIRRGSFSSKILVLKNVNMELTSKHKEISINFNLKGMKIDELLSDEKPILHSDYTNIKFFGWPNIWSIAGSDADETGLLADLNYTENLRSVKEVTGYRVVSNENYAGYIHDFLIDKENLEIKYIVVNLNNFIPGSAKEVIDVRGVTLEVKYPTAVLA